MEEKNITLVSAPAMDEEDVELDLLSLLAECFLKWKTFVILVLVGAIIGFGLVSLKGSEESKPITQEMVDAAREQLTDSKAAQVDSLISRYEGLMKLQEDLSSYYSAFASSEVVMRSEYYITSDIKDLDTIFARMAVTEDDYQAMRKIAPDEDAGATIYNRIKFSTAYEDSGVMSDPLQNSEENKYIVNVEVCGSSEEQCKSLMEVIDKAFLRQAEELKEVDDAITVESLGERVDYDTAGYVNSFRQKYIDRINSSDSQLNALDTKVKNLDGDQKAYYDLKMQLAEGAYTQPAETSRSKWTVIGAAAGFILAACLVLLPWLLNGKVLSSCELEQGGTLLNSVFIKGRKNLFGFAAAILTHADDIDPAVKADMVATDISILMEKNGRNKLMLLCSDADTEAAGFAGQVKDLLAQKNSGLTVVVGDPLRSSDELEMAADSEMGVLFAEIKKSDRSTVREWQQICRRYKLPVAGAVAVHRCW